ncbi:MAG: GH92 family glycosyl hydrolase [Acidobacteria bacterium]|nr:GH92 family glycosyl hydrolase [Acidobacteriota bacterium]
MDLKRTGRLLTLAVLTLLAAHGLLLTATAQTRDYTRWVNPFIGTGGHGHTFPGATMPFGMVQLSPDTRIDNWDGSSGYHYSDDIIYGFSHTHLSGTGIPDGADILFMPTVGEPQFFAKEGDKSVNGYASKFSHGNEKAEPGYYSVKLDDDGILAELTATKRVGFHRYTFTESSGSGNLILDLKWRDKVLGSELRIVGRNRLEGFRRSESWAKNQTTYFVAEFADPLVTAHIQDADGPIKDWKYGGEFHSSVGKDVKAAFSFREDKKQILIKVAISYVSIEGARKNLEAELPHWDFDKVRADAKAAWNKELSKIEVSGGTDEQTTNFYTALYHTMIHPNVFNDVDGRYKGHDGKVHQLRSADTPVRMSVASTRTSVNDSKSSTGSRSLAGGTGDADKSVRAPSDHYTVFSLWDTFRATHPLYTIIDERRTVDYINSFIRIYEQGGRLPVWELWGEETDTMIGYHSVSVIADAMAKGIKGFDYEKAYEAAKHSANLDHHGLAAYKRRGYISAEDDNESVSKTLEYAYNDWCILQMQHALNAQGKFTDIPRQFTDPQFFRRARYFENLFDRETGFMRPKRNGGFIEPFAPNEVTFHFTEGNSWQYSFFVPHDVPRLMELMGGREKFAAKLDELFTTDQKLAGRFQPDITGLIGQYAHGNEPSHHIPYLYNYAGQPWKTQAYVRRIMDEFYKNAPDGLIGNEDAGQMSAWYILSAAGFYPVAPGAPHYDIGSPLFPQMKFNLENGKTFTITAKNSSPANVYVQAVTLNGKPLRQAFLAHSDLLAGGTLEFEMGPKPKTGLFPQSLQHRSPEIVAVPNITADRVFRDQTTVTMSTITAGAKIYYTLDGTEPSARSTLYTSPFTLSETSTIRAIAISNRVQSFPVEASVLKRTNDWTVTLASPFSTQYTGGGDDAMVDGLRGTRNFASGEWQGYQGKVLEAVIDLKEQRRVMEVGGSFLQTTRSWIWMPSRIEFEASGDGVNFTNLAEIKTDVPLTDELPQVKEFLNKLAAPVTTRYIRVRALNIGPIPAWHPGAGGDPWIFVDEVLIR